MKKTVKRSLALFLAMVMLMSNVMTSMATEPASANGTATEETTAAQTEPTEAEGDEIPDPEEEIPGDNTTSEEGETPSNDLTETPAGSEEETTEAPTESSAPAESEPESSEESSAPTEEESTTAAETTAAESEEGSSDASADEETTPEETTETSEETTEAASDEETTTAASEEETPAETTEAPKTVYAVSTYCDPKKGGKISISDSEVKEGEDLQFTVSVNEGYVLELVYVNDEEAEASNVNDTETVYHYVVEDVASDIDIEAHFAKAEEEETVEEAPSFTMLLDEAEIHIEEVEEGALTEVDHISVEALSQDEAIEDALLRQMKDGKDVADYAAFDITLYDKDGNETEPNGAVNVVISGVSTDAEYNEVGIYHVKEMQIQRPMFFSAPANNALPNAANSAADTGDTVSYYAEEVKSQVEDKIAENGEISFVVEHFSKYVITFIKDAEEFTKVEVHAVIYDADGNYSDPTSIDHLISGDVSLRLDNNDINIKQLISGYDLAQIEDGDNLYVYGFATWGKDINSKISDEEDITYDEIQTQGEKGIYLWYEDVTDQKVPVWVVFNEGPAKGGYRLQAGKIDYTTAQSAIGSTENVYTFIDAYIEPNDPDMGSRAKITNVKLLNGNYYVVIDGESEETPYNSDDWKVVLYFVDGVAINISVEGTTIKNSDGSTTNIEGNTVSDKYGDGEDIYVRQISSDVTVQIPITIGLGYDVTITNDTTNEQIYTTKGKDNNIRSYNLVFSGADITKSQDISVVFEPMDMVFDYSHYVNDLQKPNVNDRQYHGASLNFNGTDLPDGDTSEISLELEEGDSNVLTVVNNDPGFIFNAFVINGVSVTLPNVPSAPARDGEKEDETVTLPGTSVETPLYDINGDLMANVKISVDVKYEAKGHQEDVSEWWEIFPDYVWVFDEWQQKSATYTIEFTDIKTNLKITNFNLVGTGWREARFRAIGDGIVVKSSSSPESNLQTGDAVYNPPVNIEFIPQLGYYVTNFSVDDEDRQFTDSNKWYETRRYDNLGIPEGVHYLEVESTKINYELIYQIDDAGTTKKGDGEPFTLGVDDLRTSNISDSVTPEDREGFTFVGWCLTEAQAEDPDAGFYVSGAIGISRQEILDTEGVTITPDENNPGSATITLYPKYVANEFAQYAEYTVNFFTNGKPHTTVSDGLTPRRVGQYIQRDKLLNDIDSVKAVADTLTGEGFVLDPARSDDVKTITNDPDENVFNLYYRTPDVTIIFSAGENGTLKDGDTALTEPKETFQIPGEKITGVPEPVPDANYIFIGWEDLDGNIVESLEDEPVPSKDSTYIAQFALDENGDKEPDKNQIKITFTIGKEYADQGIKFDPAKVDQTRRLDDTGTVLTVWATKGEIYPSAPVNSDLIIPQDVKLALDKWMSGTTDYADKATEMVTSDADEAYTATFDKDDNKDGEVDDPEDYFTVTYDPGTAGENAQNMPTPNPDSILKGLTYPISSTVPTWTGHIFKGWKSEEVDISNGETSFTMPDKNVTLTAQWGDDLNGDGEDDENQITIAFKIEEEGITFNETKTGADGVSIILSDDGKTLTHWLTIGKHSYPAAPTNDDLDIVPGTKKALSGWTPPYTLSGSVDDTNKVNEYVAQFKPDLNGDGIPDDTQSFQAAELQPYDTSAYSGGAQEDGFPELALRYNDDKRQVDDSVITAIVINGVRYEGAKTSDLFDAVYWQDGDAVARPKDDDGGVYYAAVVLKNAAKNSVPGSDDSNADGMLTDAEGHRIPATDYPVVIEAKYADGKEVIYNITIKHPGKLIVRYVNADDVYRPVAGSEAELVLEDGKAAAVVPDEAQLHVNGISERPVDRAKADIRLLSDEVLDLSDNRKQLLIDKGYETIGVDSESAEAQGYKSITRYFDLVDYNNGNAWVSSSHPTDVYITYPEGTNSSTDFTFIHFKDLHRENYYGDVPSAIAGADVEEVTLELHDDYIKFSTKPGTEAFSPFMLIWKTETGTGTDTPSTGGGTSSTPTGSGDATPSGPVSVQQSGNSKDYYYTAGLHGNWVHMDNVDMNVPLDEPVPAGATAVDFPEWHRWRFYLSSGVMLDNQWAHIENPYAVGDQPRSGWFYFDHDGLMRYGWYLDTRSGDWYYMHSESDGMLGTMMTGWHYDSHDNRWYYLDPQSGAMKTGWQNIGGKWYYFNPTPFGETWTLDHSTSVWRFNGNTVRPYGSMYQNEVTPDGYKVGEDGAWIQ